METRGSPPEADSLAGLIVLMNSYLIFYRYPFFLSLPKIFKSVIIHIRANVSYDKI